jgi:hypothetical protein
MGWGGVTKDGLTTLGGSKPSGFYNATYIKVDSVENQTSPVPYYLVQMDGTIGQTRQTFYAAVLDDGRIVEPVAISGPATPEKMRIHGHAKH